MVAVALVKTVSLPLSALFGSHSYYIDWCDSGARVHICPPQLSLSLCMVDDIKPLLRIQHLLITCNIILIKLQVFPYLGL